MALLKLTLPLLVLSAVLVLLVSDVASFKCFNCNTENPECSDAALNPANRTTAKTATLAVTCDRNVKTCEIIETISSEKTVKDRRCSTQDTISIGCVTDKGVKTCNHVCNHDLCNSSVNLGPLSIVVFIFTLSLSFYSWSG